MTVLKNISFMGLMLIALASHKLLYCHETRNGCIRMRINCKDQSQTLNNFGKNQDVQKIVRGNFMFFFLLSKTKILRS